MAAGAPCGGAAGARTLPPELLGRIIQQEAALLGSGAVLDPKDLVAAAASCRAAAAALAQVPPLSYAALLGAQIRAGSGLVGGLPLSIGELARMLICEDLWCSVAAPLSEARREAVHAALAACAVLASRRLEGLAADEVLEALLRALRAAGAGEQRIARAQAAAAAAPASLRKPVSAPLRGRPVEPSPAELRAAAAFVAAGVDALGARLLLLPAFATAGGRAGLALALVDAAFAEADSVGARDWDEFLSCELRVSVRDAYEFFEPYPDAEAVRDWFLDACTAAAARRGHAEAARLFTRPRASGKAALVIGTAATGDADALWALCDDDPSLLAHASMQLAWNGKADALASLLARAEAAAAAKAAATQQRTEARSSAGEGAAAEGPGNLAAQLQAPAERSDHGEASGGSAGGAIIPASSVVAADAPADGGAASAAVVALASPRFVSLANVTSLPTMPGGAESLRQLLAFDARRFAAAGLPGTAAPLGTPPLPSIPWAVGKETAVPLAQALVESLAPAWLVATLLEHIGLLWPADKPVALLAAAEAVHALAISSTPALRAAAEPRCEAVLRVLRDHVSTAPRAESEEAQRLICAALQAVGAAAVHTRSAELAAAVLAAAQEPLLQGALQECRASNPGSFSGGGVQDAPLIDWLQALLPAAPPAPSGLPAHGTRTAAAAAARQAELRAKQATACAQAPDPADDDSGELWRLLQAGLVAEADALASRMGEAAVAEVAHKLLSLPAPGDNRGRGAVHDSSFLWALRNMRGASGARRHTVLYPALNRAESRTMWRFGLPVWELLRGAAGLAAECDGPLYPDELCQAAELARALAQTGQPWLLLAAQVPLTRLQWVERVDEMEDDDWW
ncbi:hypothetical protein Rsub_05692 [Raphidocelis subcapitata]|uniref:Uncharacterized protein n=1 Tax=Raphidocelis subcapitata TaxID=307507 RepID=A0A2V0NZL5_9CHLO|nr:hypothetical protein Rsub_05692 [Raphidocelis subcapitata]|eukprot:GBF93081.1 hypothetical protein Rsub_05692 [Raphidocelis subcapitata]